MVKIVPQTSKTPPSLTVVTIDTSVENQIISNVPTDAYTGILDLYTIDGSIPKIYLSSALVMSNDTIFELTGLEDEFTVLYNTADAISIRYIYMTTVVVNHIYGTTNLRIPGYQKNIQYTFDGSIAETAAANLTTYNATDYYKVSCMRLCMVDESSDSFMFTPRLPILSYYDITNTSIYTNAAIGSVPGQNIIFNMLGFDFDDETIAYIQDDNTVFIGGIADIIGLGTTAYLLEDWMIIS
jgi:hypothetical protein